MSRNTTLVLLAAVIALAFVAWWQSGREARSAEAAEVALFPGISADEVRAIRVENVERDWMARFERDADGVWQMTDPVEVQAEQVLVRFLLDSALARQGTPVPEDEADPEKLGLAPPRVVLELELSQGGATRRERVEIGALDLDEQRVHVRARGKILRALRDIDTTVGRSVEDFKTHKPIEVDPRAVVELHRQGYVDIEGVRRELNLDALLENGIWRATAPFTAALDPVGVALWLEGITRIEIDHYLDYGTTPLSNLGLETPAVIVTLGTLRAGATTLELGWVGPNAWNGRIRGAGPVWRVLDENIQLLLVSALDLVDHRLLRYARESITALAWRTPAHEVRVTRHGREWRVARVRPPAPQASAQQPPEAQASSAAQTRADTGQVEALLARLERFEFTGFQLDRKLAPAEVTGALTIEAGDEHQGGHFGPESEGSVLFQRDGDSITALASPELYAIAETRYEDLLSLDLSVVTELDQKALALSGAGAERKYERSSKGRWTQSGFAEEARELHGVLDPLFFLRAERHLSAPEDLAPLADPISIEFTGFSGNVTRFVVGLGPAEDGAQRRAVVEIDGRRSVLRDRVLHARLAEILQAR